MTAAVQNILEMVHALSPEEQVEIVDELTIFTHENEQLSQAWDAEIERRVKDVESCRVDLIPHEVVMAELDRIVERQ